MFGGLVNHFGKVIAQEKSASALRVWIDSNFSDLELGESISVNGTCLTVDGIKDKQFYCVISPETLHLTTLGKLSIGASVNLERALRLNDRLGGHFVTGHIDQVLVLQKKKCIEEFTLMEFTNVLPECRKFLVKKGSVAINGVSLTVNDVTTNGFSVMLIPHTLQRTNLGLLQEQDAVNVEYDLLAKLVTQQVALGEKI